MSDNKIVFTDYSKEVIEKMHSEIIAAFHEASGEVMEQAASNTPVKTGQLKNNWSYKVDENKLESTIGNPLEYALWVEFGTGEYALEGNGRKGGWGYEDEDGNSYFTMGQRPKRMLHNAFITKQHVVRQAFERRLKNLGK